MDQENNVIEIDLIRLMKAFLHRWWQILFVALLGGAVALVVTMFFITPTYESTTKIYVNNSDISVGNISISAGDLSASSSLVKVYTEILNTKKTMDIVIRQADLDYTYLELMEMVEATESNGTPVLKITVTSTSPDEAHLIASTIANVLPGIIAETIRSSDAVVVDHAIYPQQQSAPSYLKNTALGVIIGAMLLMLLIAIREIGAVEIMNQEDIHQVTDIPILGHITDFDVKDRKRNYGRYYYKSSDKKGR